MFRRMKEAEVLQQTKRTYVRRHGRMLSYFSGCDYFRLASHPKVLQAVNEGLKRHGLNVAASRLTTGNHALYPKLENDLARFFGVEAALLTNSGYVTNLVVAQSLAGHFSHALMDERAHAALQDAAQFLNCPVLQFKHRTVDHFATTLKSCGPGARPVVLTDGMFSHDGSVAPLCAYSKLLPSDGLLLVDDAHGAGTLGKRGKGTIETEGVSRDRVVQTITLSKAMGVYGGAILCSKAFRKKFATSRIFVGSTPLPLPLAFAVGKSLEILQRDGTLRRRLEHNSSSIKSALREAGFEIPDAPGPIVRLHFHDSRQTARVQRALLAARILPPLIHYPGSPVNGYFRFVISSEHTQRQLENLVRALKPIARAVR
jgi:glycine C-acetyltransferase/8-amino-7-oxononanoate synthase